MLEATLKTLKTNLELPTLGIPALVLLIMAMFIVPLPPMLLDLLFTFNIITALIIVMITISMGRPMDFSAFPSVLLLATLLRLALNVASTRVVLVEGHNGTDAAGQVIESFGDFVISGNYFVGFIIFTILKLCAITFVLACSYFDFYLLFANHMLVQNAIIRTLLNTLPLLYCVSLWYARLDKHLYLQVL